MDEKRIKIILWIVAGAVGLMIGASVVIYRANLSRAALPVIGQVTPFEFTERSGRPFGQTEMKGKITIVNFFFTTCPGPCPRMNAQVAELYKLYSASDKIQFVSISVDPERDSLAALQQYALNYGVTDQRWVFLRAPIEEVHKLSERVFSLGGELPTMHSTKLVLLDDQARIRGYYSSEESASVKMLKTHILELVKELK